MTCSPFKSGSSIGVTVAVVVCVGGAVVISDTVVGVFGRAIK